MKFTFSFLSRRLLVLSLLLAGLLPSLAIRTTRLRCEMLTNPLGVDTVAPALGWQIRLDHNGISQSAYQIIAASRPDWLSEDKADLWNTGRVASGQSQWIKYAGKPLRSRDLVYWRVRVWDERGAVSSWSEVAHFGIGLLGSADWHARYIGMQRQDTTASPMLWKRFDCSRTGQPAMLQINTLGYHEVYINGERVGTDVLVPAVAEYPKRSLSMTYDVSSMLRQGRNDIVIWLGKGWYDASCPGVVKDGPYVRAEIDQLKDGKWRPLVATDKSWHARCSGYYRPGRWGGSDFRGEDVRADQLLSDLTAAALDTATWTSAIEPTIPDREATPMMCEPNKVQLQLRPVSIKRFGDDVWMVDMGRSVVGWTEVKFGKLRKGQHIRLSYCDMLGLDGDFESERYSDNYFARGEGQETFENKFNYHAYRYLKIYGLGHQPSYDDIAAYLIYTGYDTQSSFTSSDADLNAIHDMVHYTFPCLTLGGYMVDCPHLERKGYGGDGNASILSAQTMYELYPLYRNWIQAYADAQGPHGEGTHIGPNPSPCGGGPFWCVFIANAPWQTYLQYGDKRMLERYWPYMRRFDSYADKFMPDGLLTLDHRWPNSRYSHWFLGDWALPNEEHQLDKVSVDDVNSCSMSWYYGMMSKIAHVLGKQDESSYYQHKHEAINRRIHQTYYNAQDHTYAGGLQLDLAFPLLVGATPDGLTYQVNQALKDVTANRFDGHFFTGLVGIPILTQWLTEAGEAQFFYSLLKQRSYPGYLYMIDNGATTTWEHWEATRSRIHNCYNGIGSWFYQALGGIVPDESQPGYKHFYLHPQPVDGVSYVRVTRPCPYGNITVDWNKTDKVLDMKVVVPAGTTATLTVPFKASRVEIPTTNHIRQGIIYNETQKGMPDQQTIESKDPSKPVELTSGSYRIIYYKD